MVNPLVTPSSISSSTISNDQTITSSPYYMSSHDQPHHVLTHMLPTGESYEKWAKIARNNLQAKQKLGFIDGTVPKPSCDSPDYWRWIQTNSMLCGWLYASLDPKVHQVISFVDNARAMWENLRIRYSIRNASRVHQIKSDIVLQSGSDVAGYFGKLKVMWDDLDDFEPLLSCCCGTGICELMKKQQHRRDLERLHQFLMGLDAARFGMTRTNILSRLNHDDELTSDYVYYKIIAEERHLTVARSREERVNAVGFAVQSGVNAIAAAARTTFSISCTYCGRTNHTVDKCFEKHGLPEWWIEKHGDHNNRSDSSRGRGRGSNRGRGRGRSAPPRANNAEVQGLSSDVLGVSKETWNQIVNLLKSKSSAL